MTDAVFVALKKILPGIKKNVPLKRHTTFNVGGPAKYFLVADNKQTVVKALRLAKKLGVPVFVLGGGSNIVASDKGFDGLVVKIENKKHPLKVVKGTTIEVPPGLSMARLVAFAINNSLEGLEWAGGLPGSVGGAVRGNAGAFGGEMKDVVTHVYALDDNHSLKQFSAKKLPLFSYRHSHFKEHGLVIVSVKVKLKKGNKKELRKIANSRIAYRKEKHPLEFPSAGSVFKNVAVSKLSDEHKKHFADKIKNDPFPIVPAAWFIIGAGLTGSKVGGAQISHKHSNYIVNVGDATAEDILGLISLAQKKVKEVYGVDLEVEVYYLEK